MLVVRFPLRLPSAANLREHWSARQRRVRAQRDAVGWMLGGKVAPPLPVVVTLTRIAPCALDDDNLASAFKAPRDEVARWLKVDDADRRVTWAYAQRREGVRQYAVEIRVEGRA